MFVLQTLAFFLIRKLYPENRRYRCAFERMIWRVDHKRVTWPGIKG